MRLFIAINFEEKVKEQLLAMIEMMRPFASRGRFVDKENLHLTLEFLGEVDEGQVSLIKESISTITQDSFCLKFTQVGFFKRPKGKIYWLGVEQSEALMIIQKELREDLLAKGFEIEERPFFPHVTLGRKVKLDSGFSFDEINQLVDTMDCSVEKIDLMESRFVNGRLTYSVVGSQNLT